jgi:hypothetical protein
MSIGKSKTDQNWRTSVGSDTIGTISQEEPRQKHETFDCTMIAGARSPVGSESAPALSMIL